MDLSGSATKYIRGMKEYSQNYSLNDVFEDLFDDMIEALSVEIACGTHRMAKTGEFRLSDIMLPRERINANLGSWRIGDDIQDVKRISLLCESICGEKGKAQSYNDLIINTDSGTDDTSQKSICQSAENSGRDSSYDIWGRIPSKEPKTTVKCQNCGKNVSAIRFAPHLDKCMGLGTSRGSSSSSMRGAVK